MNASRVIEIIGDWDGFTLEEAVELMNAHVIKKTNAKKKTNIEHLGYVAGVVSLNEEIEILVKFADELLQLNKQAVSDLLEILPDDD